MNLLINPPGSEIRLGTGARVVREYPRTQHELHIDRPDGSTIRIAGDEPRSPLSDYAFYTALPGGHTTADATTLRLTDERIPKHSRCRFLTADGRQVWQGRVEASAEESDDGVFRLSLVGDERLLDDASSVTFLGCDSSLDSWQEPPRKRRKSRADGGSNINGAFSVSFDEEGIDITMDPDRNVQITATGEAWYVSPDHLIGSVQYIASEVQGAGMLATVRAYDSLTAGSYGSATIDTTLAVTTFTPSAAAKYLALLDTPTGAAANKSARLLAIHAATVYGDHGLPLHDIEGLPQGMKFSDIIPHLIQTHQPLLALGEIEESNFIVPDAKWLEPLSLREILEQGSELEYGNTWAVWDGALTWGKRRQMGSTWALRRSEGAEFIDSGEAGEPDYNGVTVAYEARDGSLKWAGPPGSGADTEDASLYDSDPHNPINASSAVGDKFFQVEAQGLTPEKAVEAGAQALQELLETRFVGEIQVPPFALRDGVWQPTSLMRADDWIYDAERGVRMPLSATAYRPSEKPMTATVDLPARRLDARLARQGLKPRRVGRKSILRGYRKARKRRRKQSDRARAQRRKDRR